MQGVWVYLLGLPSLLVDRVGAMPLLVVGSADWGISRQPWTRTAAIPRLTEAVAGHANTLDPLAVGATSFVGDTLRPPRRGTQQIGHLFDSVDPPVSVQLQAINDRR